MTYANLELIVAMGENQEIGYLNDLIWRIKEDLIYFKNTTMNSYIIVGRNTFLAMPPTLKGRKYVIVTHQNDLKENYIVCNNLDEVLKLINDNPEEHFFVIGGKTIYQLLLPYVSKIHLTQIKDTFPLADTYFPPLEKDAWEEEFHDYKTSDNDLKYERLILTRKKRGENE